MTDAERARNGLAGHTLCLVKGGDSIVSDARGIRPMLDLLASGRNLTGYSAADVVVGKAAAMLFVKAGVAHVYAGTLSESAEATLVRFGVPYTFGCRTQYIVNRAGTGPCPMESAVLDCDDVETAYRILSRKAAEL